VHDSRASEGKGGGREEKKSAFSGESPIKKNLRYFLVFKCVRRGGKKGGGKREGRKEGGNNTSCRPFRLSNLGEKKREGEGQFFACHLFLETRFSTDHGEEEKKKKKRGKSRSRTATLDRGSSGKGMEE